MCSYGGGELDCEYVYVFDELDEVKGLSELASLSHGRGPGTSRSGRDILLISLRTRCSGLGCAGPPNFGVRSVY